MPAMLISRRRFGTCARLPLRNTLPRLAKSNGTNGYPNFARTAPGGSFACPCRRQFANSQWTGSEHNSIRTSDLFRVNLHLTFTFNNLTAHGIPPKHLYLRVSRLNFG